MAPATDQVVQSPNDRWSDADPPPKPSVATDLTIERVHAEHFPFIWRSLRGLGVPAAALDDAAQEVLLVVHRRLAEFEGRSTLRSWLFSIAYGVARNQRRTLRRRGEHEQISPEMIEHAPGPEACVESRQALRFVEEFLDRLDQEKRALFVLALLEQLPAPEVACALGVPINTVYSRIRLMREEFRRALARYHVGAQP